MQLWRFARSASVPLFSVLLLAAGGCGGQPTGSTVRPPNGLRPIETVATFSGPMPTGVTVSRGGRVFVNFPRWGDAVDFTVAELKGGQAVAYPDAVINRLDPDHPERCLVSVQSVVVDPKDRLWIVDTGAPALGPTVAGGPKLIGVDLKTDQIFKTISFPDTVALKTTYLNDVRFDLRRGAGGFAFITDSSDKGPNGIIVVDLDSGRSWRRLSDHPSTKAEKEFIPYVNEMPLMVREPGKPPQPLALGSDGIAISADGSKLFYCPLASRSLYSVSVDALIDEKASEDDVARTVEDYGKKPGGSDGLESDDRGRIYVTDYEHNAIYRRPDRADARPQPSRQSPPLSGYETVVQDPAALWPDTMSVAADGYLYFTANQLHRQARFHDGIDLRKKPYYLYRVKIDAGPVRLAK